jgi:hypothetical protein
MSNLLYKSIESIIDTKNHVGLDSLKNRYLFFADLTAFSTAVTWFFISSGTSNLS